MKKIKIAFLDKWGGWKPKENIFYRVLSRHYDVEISERPDYLICGTHTHKFIYRKEIKIFDCMENLVPDFNFYDYAIGFDYLTFGDRYVRIPYYAMVKEYAELEGRAQGAMPSDEDLLNRKFCSFVVSNGTGSSPLRAQFYERLSKYKKVDSGGRFMNNIGGPVPDKMAFIKGYKFNIAFENSSCPGYTTEKVMEPLAAWSVPIYWGNERIGEDFDVGSMIVVRDKSDIDRAIDEIVYLDSNDEAYLAKVKAPCMVREYDYFEKRLESFLTNIFDQPIEAARRIPAYGFSPIYRHRIRHLYWLDDLIKKPFRYARPRLMKLKRAFGLK